MRLGGFDVDLKSLGKQRGQDYLFLVVHLHTQTAPRVDVAEIRFLADAVVEHMEAEGFSNPVRAEGWVGLGPDRWIGVLTHTRQWDDVLEWLEVFTTGPMAALRGQIGGPPRNEAPRLRTDSFQLSALAAYTTVDLRQVDRDERRRIWGVDRETTLELAQQMADWTLMPRADGYLYYAPSFRGVDTDLGLPFGEAILRQTVTTVTHVRADRNTLRLARTRNSGRVGYYLYDLRTDVQSRVAQARKAILWRPELLDLAVVRYSIGTWDSVSPPWPRVREGHFGYNRPLLAVMVPDVNGIQILTDAHLQRAHDLSAWTVEPLANGRHLVTHPDTDTWYADREPPADMLAQARDDFGDMIMTIDKIEAESPWGYKAPPADHQRYAGS